MKRKSNSQLAARPQKRLQRPLSHCHQPAHATTAAGVEHPVLRRLYPNLFTLRHYLLSQLPRTSKNRRRRILQLGRPIAAHESASTTHALDADLGKLLDTAVIGTFTTPDTENYEQVTKKRNEDINVFTQQRSQPTAGGTFKPGYFLQAEVLPWLTAPP